MLIATMGFSGLALDIQFIGVAGVRPLRVTWDSLERRHPAAIRHFDETREAIEWP